MLFEVSDHSLPIIFAGLIALSILIYVVLDGFDLGIGLIFPSVDSEEKDKLISSIAPFWDMNETWLILAVGLLLVGFPFAQGIIMSKLYIPIALMLWGLILRGAAIDFRKLDRPKRRQLWNQCFFLGSLLATLAQGFMLGSYVQGFSDDPSSLAISTGIAILTAQAYRLVGACWLIAKTRTTLQKKAIGIAQDSLLCLGLGFAWFGCITHLESVAEKMALSPIRGQTLPLLISSIILTYGYLYRLLKIKPINFQPYAVTLLLYSLIHLGVCLKIYPYIVPYQMLIWQAAADAKSLSFILQGAMLSLPVIVISQCYVFWVFRGKSQLITYE